MKNNILTILFLFLLHNSNAQSLDTISSNKKGDVLSYKHFMAPVVLLSTGFLLKGTETNLKLQKNFRNVLGTDYRSTIDDHIQYVPIVQIYLGKTLGFKPKNDFYHQTINIAAANLIMAVAVFTMKHSFQEPRPDLSNNLSFPSGHTAIAFTNAALLYYEFKDSNLWYASSGFLFSTATAALRVANNKHYTSDVLAGAGIGLASGLIVSYWNPLKSMTFGKKKQTTALVYPQIGNQIGLGALIQLN